jgi:DNA repair exonuclease SbcCD ATPase subunit
MQHIKRSVVKFIHNGRPDGRPSTTTITFAKGGIKYRLTRSYASTKTACVYIGDDVVVEGLTTVDAWVTANVGTHEQMLMNNIICQVDLDNFLHAKQEDQKAVFDRMLSFDCLAPFGKVLKDSRAGHASVLMALKASLASMDGLMPTIDHDTTDKTVSKYAQQVLALQDDISELEHRRNKLACEVDDVIELSKVNSSLRKARKKLEEYSDLSQSDKDKALLIKGEHYGRLTDMQEKLSCMGEPTMELSVYEMTAKIQDIRATLERMEADKPTPAMSMDLLQRNVSEYTTWMSSQKTEYLDDPDKLHDDKDGLATDIRMYQTKLDKMYDNMPSKPMGVKPHDIVASSGNMDALRTELTAKRKLLAQLAAQRGNMPYMQWEKQYDVWCDEVREVTDIEYTESQLQSRYDEYMKYIGVVELKQASQREMQETLAELELELSQMGELPFNAECWACKLQPMRLREEQLGSKVAVTKKALAKVQKYIAQLGDVDLNDMKHEAKTTKRLIGKLGYYTATYERFMSEKAAWESYNAVHVTIASLEAEMNANEWYIYTTWNHKVTKLKECITVMQAEHTDIERFLSDFPRYHAMNELIKTEQKERALLTEWQMRYDALREELATMELELSRLNIVSEIEGLKATMEVNTGLLDRLKAWSALEETIAKLERMLVYHEYQAVIKQLTDKRDMFVDVKSRMLALQKEVDTTRDYSVQRDTFTETIRVYESRLAALTILVAKFAGDRTTSDGFREFVYNTHVIPQLQLEVNTFLAEFEDIRVEIEYSSKVLSYHVLDRGNITLFDMASGYQRFIISLAFRAALAKMQTGIHTINHLFIDEGFVSCDAINMAKASVILKTLITYGGYHDIILMSHSAEVKQVTDLTIDIERGEFASTLRWGMSPLEENTKVVKPKRAIRSKKKTSE